MKLRRNKIKQGLRNLISGTEGYKRTCEKNAALLCYQISAFYVSVYVFFNKIIKKLKV